MNNFRICHRKNINVSPFKFARSKRQEGEINIWFLKKIAMNNDFVHTNYIRGHHRSFITVLHQ